MVTAKKLDVPVESRHVEELSVRSRKKCRRSKAKKSQTKQIVVMYANIQGFRGKRDSLGFVMDSVKADVVLLAETMVRQVSIESCKCKNPKKLVGQNV